MIRSPNASRSFVYATVQSRAACAAAAPATPIDRRSSGRFIISCTKPLPSTPPMRFSSGTNTSLNESSAVSCPWKPILWSFLPCSKPSMPSSSSTQAERIGTVALAGLDERDDEVGGRTRRDERLGAVDDVAAVDLLRGGLDAAQVGPGTGLGHRECADTSPVAMRGSHFSFCSCVPMCTRYGTARSSWMPKAPASEPAPAAMTSSFTTARKR